MQKSLEGEFVIDKHSPKESTPPSHPTHKKHHHKHVRMFSHFVEYPSNIRIENQDEDEEILLILRGHIIANLPWFLFVLLLSCIPILLPFVLSTVNIILQPSTIFVIVIFYYVVILGYALINFSLWFFHVTVVTNKKVTDVDLHGILSRDIVDAPLHSILDVGYTQTGIFATIFNYGDISLQTETRIQSLEIAKAPRPAQVVDFISDILTSQGGKE